jgi:hypothetical protein
MLELIILLSIVMVALSIGMLLLKFVFAMVLLPLKLAFLMTKGLLTLVFVVPLMLVLGTLFLAVIPVGAFVLLLPVILLGGLTLKIVSF